MALAAGLQAIAASALAGEPAAKDLVAKDSAAKAPAPVSPRAACSVGLRPWTPAADDSGLAGQILAIGSAPSTLRWAGLASPLRDENPALAAETAGLVSAWLASAEPRGLSVLAAGPTDRWGRAPVLVLSGDAVLNALLIRQGLALFSPGGLSSACARALQAEEEAARRAGVGLWAPGAPAPLRLAERPADILEREGRYTIVEGRVIGLGETKTRVYLNFGTVRSEDFTVSIQKRNLRKVEASGMRWTSWEGRRIRVRGVVVQAGGPLIEVSSPDDVERLD